MNVHIKTLSLRRKEICQPIKRFHLIKYFLRHLPPDQIRSDYFTTNIGHAIGVLHHSWPGWLACRQIVCLPVGWLAGSDTPTTILLNILSYDRWWQNKRRMQWHQSVRMRRLRSGIWIFVGKWKKKCKFLLFLWRFYSAHTTLEIC